MSIDWNALGITSQDPALINAYANAANAGTSNYSAIAQAAYNQAKLNGDNDRLAFDKANAALSQAMNYSNTFGYAPGGNWQTWGPGGPSQPIPGTSPLSAQGQWFSQANTAAGLTGYFNNPMTWQYQPGTFVISDPNQGGNGAVGQILPNGQIQQISGDVATAMGYNPQLAARIPGNDFYTMTIAQQGGMGLGQGQTQQTIAAQQAMAGMAKDVAGVTGLYTAPQQTSAQLWQTLDRPTQEAYIQQAGGNLAQAQANYAQVAGTPTPQASLQMQALYGSYGVPTAGQQTMAQNEQNYTQWLRSAQEARLNQQLQQQTANNYLTLLSNLRGPADYAKYQQVLGATPGGMSDLVRAAAGQYIPGGGATTGVQPQAVNLQNFVGQVGQGTSQDQQNLQNSLVAPNQMAPQTWNALTDSQKQMLLGTWEAQGYTQADAKNLFSQSLPKYATNAPATGQFKLM